MVGKEVTVAAEKIEELKIAMLEESKGTGSSSVKVEINTGSIANGEGGDEDDDQAQSQDAAPGNLFGKKNR